MPWLSSRITQVHPIPPAPQLPPPLSRCELTHDFSSFSSRFLLLLTPGASFLREESVIYREGGLGTYRNTSYRGPESRQGTSCP